MVVFRIHYEKTISQANTVGRLGNTYEDLIRQLEDMEREARENWQGCAADTFLRQSGALKEDMRLTCRKTVRLAEAIKSAAVRIRREDEAAARRAKKIP